MGPYQAADPLPSPPGSSDPAPPPRRPTIMVVDDEDGSRRSIRMVLEDLDADVVTFASGASALEFAERYSVALVLLDVLMPQMDGFQTAAALRRLEAYRHVPLVFMSGARKDSVQLFEAYATGAVDYLLKPIDPTILESKVRVFLDLHNQKEQLTRLVGELSQKKALERLVKDLERTHQERDVLQAELEQSEARLRTIVSENVDGLLVLDGESIIKFANPAAAELLGAHQDDLVGQVFFFDDDEQRMVEELRGGGFVELRVNSIVWEGVSARLVALRDVTERIRLEQEQATLEMQLRQAQKLEAIGQLAAGVAHEINTPNQYISSNTEFLRKSFTRLASAMAECEARAESTTGGGEVLTPLRSKKVRLLLDEIPKALEQTLEGIEQVATIVRSMKEFSHPGAPEKELTDLHRAIESCIVVSRAEWKYVAEIHTELEPNLPSVPCLAGEIKQVILNLIVNAAHAIEEAAREGPGSIQITTRLRDGAWVDLEVSDSGTGIPERIRDKIFEPFFTTKEVGKGTGQGLALAYNTVVKKHHGAIDVRSAVGEGTTIVVSLPVSASETCAEE